MTSHVRRLVVLAFAAAALFACAAPRRAPEVEAPSPPARAWSDEALAQLRAAASSAAGEGLPAETEAIGTLDALLGPSRQDAAAALRLDQAADVLFARLAKRFARGAIDPARVDPDWRIPQPSEPDMAALAAAVAGGHVGATLQAFLPDAPEYAALKLEMERVSAEPAGALDAHGRSREVRIDRLRANLERWRWLPRRLPARRIEVHPARFELVARSETAPAAVHRVIVGTADNPTPSFAAEIESVTFNPSWTPPSSIAVGELLPRFRRDPAAAAREGFDVIDAQGRVVDPTAVDWSARPFRYTLRQRPGPGNALGQVRFDLPNPYAVYLHDTPSRGLFTREVRLFSHGCIRVAEPRALAERLLDSADWSASAIEETIDAGRTRVIPLPAPVPVYVLYFTAFASEDGTVAYAEDVYGRDRALVAALDGLAAARELAQTDYGAHCGAA